MKGKGAGAGLDISLALAWVADLLNEPFACQGGNQVVGR